MILSLLTITIAFIWLMVETHYMTIRLASGEIPIHDTTPIKRQPILEPCRIINVSYPVPEPIKLLAEFCEATQFQNKVVTEKWKHLNPDNCINWQMKPAYQQMTICGHALTLLASSSKLYDTMAEFQKIADGKDRKPALKFAPLMPLIEQVKTGSDKVQCGMRGGRKYYEYRDNYETKFKDCLCGKEWLKAHYQDVIPEPTIDLVVNGKETHFNGNFRTGCVHEFMVVNAELWERPRIKGKKIKVEVN